jgi:two-component system LytT family response regulator
MSPLRVITVDDEPLARERVSDLVREADGVELVAEAGNGLQALDLITALAPDLAFLDVEMPELSGFGVVAALAGEALPGIVFITAYEHYALKAFEVGAIDYLHKPVTRGRFATALDRARQRLAGRTASHEHALIAGAAQAERARGTRTRFVVREGNRHVFVAVEQVDWVDSVDNYLRLHVGGRTHLCRGTLKELEQELDPARFARIHRAAIVAIDRIASIRSHASGGHELELRDGARLRSSRHYHERVRGLLR